MEFAEVVRRRRMIRRYGPEPVASEVVDRMLEHAQRAPSAGFSQGTSWLVLDTPEDVARFWTSTGADPEASNPWLDGMRTAPVVLVPLASKAAYAARYSQPDKGQDVDQWPVPYWYVDSGMASLLVLQSAVDEGLGACFFGIPPEHREQFKEAFDIPGDQDPIGAITVGHRVDDSGSKGSPARRGRRTNAVHRGRWGTTVTS